MSSASAPSLGEQLDEIMRDMDAAYAAMQAAGYPGWDSPEGEAVEAVYVRLRAWNLRAALRTARTPGDVRAVVARTTDTFSGFTPLGDSVNGFL